MTLKITQIIKRLGIQGIFLRFIFYFVVFGILTTIYFKYETHNLTEAEKWKLIYKTEKGAK